MIFIRLRLVELKWGLAMLFGCAMFGMSGVLCLSIPYLLLVGALIGFFGIAIPADLDAVFALFFALGVVIGLPQVAEHFGDGFKSEIQPLRKQRSDRRLSKTLCK